MVFEPNLSIQNPEKAQSKIAKGTLAGRPLALTCTPSGYSSVRTNPPGGYWPGSYCSSGSWGLLRFGILSSKMVVRNIQQAMPPLQASFPIGFFQIGFQNPKRFSFGLGSHCNSVTTPRHLRHPVPPSVTKKCRNHTRYISNTYHPKNTPVPPVPPKMKLQITFTEDPTKLAHCHTPLYRNSAKTPPNPLKTNKAPGSENQFPPVARRFNIKPQHTERRAKNPAPLLRHKISQNIEGPRSAARGPISLYLA
jgi:hypothetical protein